ncbi:MAG: HAMP domain-containing protein [Magnetococcales bacterium]|nr:HAMP domain-containing protein [Magnetococcales bacterium]
MTRSSIRFKTYTALLLIALATMAAGGTMVHTIERVKEDTDVVVALDRQRMLTQTMAKAAMGYVLAKSGSQSLEQQVRTLDAYLTQLERTLATQSPPSTPPPTSTPYCPAQTLLRQTNQAFGTRMEIPITILGLHPLNPDNRLQDAIDRQAFDWLQTHPGQLFSTATKGDEPLKLRFYTAIPLDEAPCVSCHQGDEKTKPMGIRRFGFHFSGDIALGKAELEPSLIEYYLSRDLFKATLMALRYGGTLPLERAGGMEKHIEPLDVPAVKTRLEAMETLFNQFTASVQELFKAPLGSDAYRQARQAISEHSNRLRAISEDLVQRHTALLVREQEKKILLVATVVLVIILVVILGAALTIRRTLLTPLATLHEATRELANGNLKARAHLVRHNDEIGQMGQAFNFMAQRLTQTIQRLRLHSGSLATLTRALVELERTMDKNIRTGSVLNRQAEGWMRHLEQTLAQIPEPFSPTSPPPDLLADLRLHASRLNATMTEAMKLSNINYGVLDHARLLTSNITEVNQSLHETEQGPSTGESVLTTLKQDYLHWLGHIITVIRDPHQSSPAIPDPLRHPENLPSSRWLATEGATLHGHSELFPHLLAAHMEFQREAAEALNTPRPMDQGEALHWMERLDAIRKRIFLYLDRIHTAADH